MTDNDGPLAGVRVVEMGSVIMVPYACQQLGDLGADVIKIEAPGGDSTRNSAPRRHPGMGAGTLNLNRNKRSVALDLKSESGRAALHTLLDTADVLITNTRPGALSRLGLDPEAVVEKHPRLVYATAHGYRAGSPHSDRAAYDDIVQSVSGLVSMNEAVTGQPAYLPTVLADKVCGMQIVSAVLAAVHHRNATGRGQHVEIPMVDTMLAFTLVEHLAAATFPGGTFGYPRGLSRHRRAARTADGAMCLLPYSDRNVRDFFAFAGRPEVADDPRFASVSDRAQHADDFYDAIDAVAALHTTAQWQEFCDAASIPAAPVLDLARAVSTAYARESGVLRDAVHPSEGPYRLIGNPVRFGEHPDRAPRPCPTLGEHTDEVLAELDLEAVR